EGKGIWAASGVNAANVGMTATETITSNPRVLGADPLVEYQPFCIREQQRRTQTLATPEARAACSTAEATASRTRGSKAAGMI
uniref:C69 family dipeptidase n=1 Tax=Dysosmobacter welbionis TaxID=2093857 RepID=UPI003FF099C7